MAWTESQQQCCAEGQNTEAGSVGKGARGGAGGGGGGGRGEEALNEDVAKAVDVVPPVLGRADHKTRLLHDAGVVFIRVEIHPVQ